MSENLKTLQLVEWRDDSMGNNTLRFKFEFDGFSWREAKAISDESIQLASKLADQLEKDLKGF